MKGWFLLAFELFLLCDALGWVQLGWQAELRALAHLSDKVWGKVRVGY